MALGDLVQVSLLKNRRFKTSVSDLMISKLSYIVPSCQNITILGTFNRVGSKKYLSFMSLLRSITPRSIHYTETNGIDGLAFLEK